MSRCLYNSDFTTFLYTDSASIEQPPVSSEIEPIPKVKQEKEYIQQNYETESGKLAQIIIPKDATQDDLAAISDMLDILIKRRFKTEIK